MDVIEVPRKIAFVAERVLPITPLPNAALAFAGTACRDRLVEGQGVREYCFDEAPAQRKIGIAFGQGPNGMQVVGQNDDRLEIEGMAASDIAECPAQRVDVGREQTPPAIGQIHREEKAAAGEEVTPVVGHRQSITKAPRQRDAL
jgi:hypothetical protein